MAFSNINGTEEVFCTEVYDTFGKRVEKWKCNKKDFVSVVKILNDKWGLGMKFVSKEKKSDLDWLK
jgi:hypothetical protein